jgi:hypothetical protein
MHVDWVDDGAQGKLIVRYRDRIVMSTKSANGFAQTILAPGTSGNLCIAKVVGYPSPVLFDYAVNGACCDSSLQVIYPVSNNRYRASAFDAPDTSPVRLAVLAEAVAVVTGDPRFEMLFTDGAGTATPVQVSRLADGHLVDVSAQFPEVVAIDVKKYSQWYRIRDVFVYIGDLEAWIADECRLGKGREAWGVATNQVEHGIHHAWLSEYEPQFIQQLSGDFKRWGYCVA